MLIRTKAERGKDLVKLIEEATGSKSKYLGPPSFSYEIGEIKILRNGDIEAETECDELIRVLREEDLLVETEEDSVEVSVPIGDFDAKQLSNLIFIIYSRQKLINASIGSDNFYVDESIVNMLREDKPEDIEKVKEQTSRYEMTEGFHFSEDKVIFTGFPIEGITAYCSLAAMMVSQARNCKRATAKIVEAENEKYAGRVWLNQLGLGGRGGAEVRKVFLKNLKGNGSFRTEESQEKWNEKRRKEKNVVSSEIQ